MRLHDADSPVSRSGSPSIKVLMYHRVVTDRELSDRYWFCVHAEDFAKQLALLDHWGISTITFEDYRLFLRGELDLPPKAVILTFDDGYQDTYTTAFPLLQERGMKAVVFVIGERKIRTNIWDERIGLPSAPLMEDHQILELRQAGFEIGSHTMTHSDLLSLTEDNAWKEISRSRMLLEILLNDSVQTFSYPFGLANTNVKRMVENAGYDLACAGEVGAAVFGADPYEIKRIKIGSSTRRLGFAFRMLTPFEYLTSAYSKGRRLLGANGNGKHEPSTPAIARKKQKPINAEPQP